MILVSSFLVLLTPLAPQGAEQVPPSAEPTEAAPAVEEPPWTPAERAAIELLRSLRKKERPDDLELAARLSPAGQRLLPLFFEVLATRSVPALETGKPQVLSEIQEKAVLLGVSQLERGPVLAYLGASLAVSAEVPRRRAAIACLGAVGHANDLPQLFDLTFVSEEHVPDARLLKALESAVSALLARDPHGVEQLITLRRVTRPELLATLVEAVGSTHDPRGLAYLAEVAYWHENLILDVMSQVPLLGPSGDDTVDGALRVRMRTYLDEDRPGLCRAAVTALTALHDTEAIGTLIPLLDTEQGGLAQNAHWALKRLTGLSMGPSAETWSRWHQAEMYWLVRQKPKAFQRLRENDPAAVAAALREVLAHPLARGELATALPDLLRSRWPALRILACTTLAELDAQDSIGRLVWALEDRDPEVARAAHAALRRLSHLDLPLDPALWQEATHTEPRDTEL